MLTRNTDDHSRSRLYDGNKFVKSNRNFSLTTIITLALILQQKQNNCPSIVGGCVYWGGGGVLQKKALFP